MDCQAGSTAVIFQQDSISALNSFERPANRIRLAAEHFEFRALAEIVSRFGGSAVVVQHQAAVIKGPGVATATLDRRIQ
jgi:hypothetical protein